jgi:DNA polymerase-3 subunit delta
MASVMSHVQLESALKQQRPGSLYLVVGEEDLLRDSALGVIKRATIGSEGNEFNYELFYGDDAHGIDIRNSVAAVPVFAERRLVVVKAAEK